MFVPNGTRIHSCLYRPFDLLAVTEEKQCNRGFNALVITDCGTAVLLKAKETSASALFQ
jgi:hypothetical protein